jgi:succinate dehydrogenase/fumarate reductase flavoprotein subunit
MCSLPDGRRGVISHLTTSLHSGQARWSTGTANGDVARFDATRRDGLAAAAELQPPKSNWARPITKPPFLAYPLIGAIAYTFGGLATNEKAEVLGKAGPMPGLYAAGETTGHFYGTAPNAVAVLRALVFGRIAGREAVDFAACIDATHAGSENVMEIQNGFRR